MHAILDTTGSMIEGQFTATLGLSTSKERSPTFVDYYYLKLDSDPQKNIDSEM